MKHLLPLLLLFSACQYSVRVTSDRRAALFYQAKSGGFYSRGTIGKDETRKLVFDKASWAHSASESVTIAMRSGLLTKVFAIKDVPVDAKVSFEDADWKPLTRAWAAILDRKIYQGMTKEEVRLSWGSPRHSSRTVTRLGVSEMWHYGDWPGSTTTLWFEDGLLTGWHED